MNPTATAAPIHPSAFLTPSGIAVPAAAVDLRVEVDAPRAEEKRGLGAQLLVLPAEGTDFGVLPAGEALGFAHFLSSSSSISFSARLRARISVS